MKQNRLKIGLVLASVTAVAAGCGTGSSSSSSDDGKGGLEQSSVSVGVLPLADYAAAYWADDHGFFKKHGLKVKLETLQGGPVGVQKVITGELQFSFSNSISSTIASAKGAPVKTVALTSSLGPKTQAIVVKPDSKIKSIDDLDGKTIGVNTVNNIGDVNFKNLAKSTGLKVKPEWVEVLFPEMIDGVRNGSIDAGYVPEPFASAASAAGLRTVVDLVTGPNVALPAATFVTSDSYVAKNPKTVAAFQAAINEASKDISANENEFRKWLPTVSQTPVEAAKVMKLPIFESSLTNEKMQRVADILIGLDLVEGGYKAAGHSVISGN